MVGRAPSGSETFNAAGPATSSPGRGLGFGISGWDVPPYTNSRYIGIVVLADLLNQSSIVKLQGAELTVDRSLEIGSFRAFGCLKTYSLHLCAISGAEVFKLSGLHRGRGVDMFGAVRAQG